MKSIFLLITLMLSPALSSAGDIGISYSSSSSSVESNTMSAEISDQSGPFDFRAEYNYGKTDGIVSTDNGEVSIGYDPIITERVSLWFDERVGYNKMMGVRFENFVGFGPKYYIMKSEERKLSLSTGILYHYRADAEEGDGRYSHRIKYGDAWISGVYFYQPNMRDSSDYITEGEIRIKLSDVLSVLYREEYRSLDSIREIEKMIMFNFHFDFKEVK
ncbi:MAG: DUF481 domain-containing protein [Deltaproteobacteria bacterium]|nr:DUF481 domain-containing protein [Deltaproteobacteria bacterium]